MAFHVNYEKYDLILFFKQINENPQVVLWIIFQKVENLKLYYNGNFSYLTFVIILIGYPERKQTLSRYNCSVKIKFT